MVRMKIALVSKMDDEARRAKVREVCPEAELLRFWDDRDGLARRGGEVEVVYGNVRPDEFDKLSKLTWVHATWTGVENLLHEKIVNSEVIVTNTRGQNGPTMAEHALAGLMYLARDLPTFVTATRQGVWKPEGYAPRRIDGATVLVMGTGAIAEALRPKLAALGARLIGVNRDGRAMPGYARCDTLDTVGPVLGEVDFVVVLLPATDATRHALNRAFMAALRPGAGIVNVARGSIIEPDAMIDLIDAGHLGGAVLDVTTPEPPPADSPLFGHDRILLTGHRSWQPAAPNAVGFETFLHNLACYRDGRIEDMKNLVDKRAGY